MPHDHADGSEGLEAAKNKYIGIMKEFLEIREWTDEFEVNEDSAQINLDTGLNIGDQQGHLFVHLNYDNDMVDVYVYYGFRCKKTNLVKWLNY